MAEPTVLVVGGGVMGMATGCALAGQGARVTVLERVSLAHAWASSHGLTRAIRHEYGTRAIYSQMVARSLTLWQELQRETGRSLYTAAGVLTLGYSNDGETLAGYDVLRGLDLPVERLTPGECQARFPQFDPHEYDAILYNSVGGMLHASECLLALADRLRARGGVLREGAQVTRLEANSQNVRVHLADGQTLTADRVVVTAGPWVHDVLPERTLPIRATRQQVCYFSGLAPAAFDSSVFPVFLAQDDYYGFPLQGSGWLKVAAHTIGDQVDPNVPYAPDDAGVAAVRDFLRRVIPSAAEAPLAMVDRCMYDMSPDEDFILDRLPESPAIVLGSGFSGHGFKFGILIGELLAALVLDAPPAFPLERFKLSRFAQVS